MNRNDKDMKTVLVVEDYDDIRGMLKVLLESEHLRVLEAASGLEALSVIKTERPDVVLMDLGLPGFDGFETIRRMRKMDGFQNTPIIVLSGYTGQSMKESAFLAGSNYFMSKPVDFDALESLLKQILLDGNVYHPKGSRSAAQRAVNNNKKSVSLPETREVPLAFNYPQKPKALA